MRRPNVLDELRGVAERARSSDRAEALRARGPLELWHVVGRPGEPAFAAGWSNAPGNPGAGLPDAYRPAAFKKDVKGYVHLAGKIHTPGDGLAIGTSLVFTLPLNYRPPQKLVFTSSSLGLQGFAIQVESNGKVSVRAGWTAGDPTLDGISWRV